MGKGQEKSEEKSEATWPHGPESLEPLGLSCQHLASMHFLPRNGVTRWDQRGGSRECFLVAITKHVSQGPTGAVEVPI